MLQLRKSEQHPKSWHPITEAASTTETATETTEAVTTTVAASTTSASASASTRRPHRHHDGGCGGGGRGRDVGVMMAKGEVDAGAAADEERTGSVVGAVADAPMEAMPALVVAVVAPMDAPAVVDLTQGVARDPIAVK
ncbi:GL22845 [Drosophila persimilis]|uniref:GL22845 n=1 Tax=Drosophila persimilis TaxID=7234 RepID=B4GZP4_DROPE|nr:GL22845 [Drosophila persimilis]